ncbi:glycosyltransferase [Solemya elarraichensis gill symbiont]|uniref:Glycosyltransferase subfamily 4-like N-terminal domain-containing protein n=1 Tax=Solemya elarraichensis gill symbiont TaxID=1918949 RepID=A0A1T2L772_9GAMM|nr:glycosyltransferase family 4 protein [Solemya elarraichensis gill symbiont]OOZ40923.1 hypothetical protein BOW52_05230 [Solemya elarraichensis gill symbiont]
MPEPLVLITKGLDPNPSGGRELLCKLNYDALQEIYNDQLILIQLIHSPLRSANEYANTFRGHIDGLNSDTITAAINKIKKKNVTRVFVDGSNLGGFVHILKKTLPEVEITTFFHNVESRFFLGSFRQRKSLRSFLILIANYLAERKAVRYSDKIICLNQRDSDLLRKTYGRVATHIAPMALEDKMPIGFGERVPADDEDFALFVGGTFYANQAGITWFVKNVVPHIDIKICIVGRGFEKLRDELEVPGKVEVVGAVDSLAVWYRRARFVIAPIFDGSGMKTKVAEALMYGKKIVGTPEAFTGYEDIADQVGFICETSDQFVNAIRLLKLNMPIPFNPRLREIYINNYSLTSTISRLELILNDTVSKRH